MSRTGLFLFAIGLCCSLSVPAGTGDTLRAAEPRVPRRMLRIETNALFDATTIRNELLLKLYRGGMLDRKLRERSQGALDGRNRAGYELDLRADLSWGDSLFGHAHWRPRIGIGWHETMGLRFADDVYDLTFFGNGAYEDRTAQLAPSTFEQMGYRTVGFGIEREQDGSFLMLHVVNGGTFARTDLRRADLYTAIDGRYLELDLDGDLERSDTAEQRGLRSNGIGAAISGELNRFGRICGRATTFTFRLDDLGFVVWNDRSLAVHHDAPVRYDGIRVEDVLDLDDILIGSNEVQDTLGLGYTAGQVIRPLPARLMVRLRTLSKNVHWRYDLTLDQRYLPGYVPHASLSVVRLWHPVAVMLEGSYGGFGSARIGAGVQLTVCRNVDLVLRTPNVVGAVSDQARGAALLLGVEAGW